MSSIQNLQSFDPFADATKGDDLLPAGTEDYIHIRIQQRNGRKTLTTVQGIADDYDKKKLVKAFKKKFACNGTVIEHPEYGEVIQLQDLHDCVKHVVCRLETHKKTSTIPPVRIQCPVSQTSTNSAWCYRS
ncbi:eukaryotic translation initiation factor 1b [Grus japonensis]|uniref:Eukaryotic translation initiation factor 1b n=1 Tax=Grus japonensis TaxID=30415 RepID=A0ABC9WI06_GRUJA